MKKILAMTLALSLLTPLAFASERPVLIGQNRSSAVPPDDLIDHFKAEYPNMSYGGSFYDGDVLVINFVPKDHMDNPSAMPEDSDGIRFNCVQYSLDYLEQVKEYLSGHMDRYHIQLLDANEVTNKVDVCLSVWDPEMNTAIADLIRPAFGSDDMLALIDTSNVEILTTVGLP